MSDVDRANACCVWVVLDGCQNGPGVAVANWDPAPAPEAVLVSEATNRGMLGFRVCPGLGWHSEVTWRTQVARAPALTELC